VKKLEVEENREVALASLSESAAALVRTTSDGLFVTKEAEYRFLLTSWEDLEHGLHAHPPEGLL